MSLWNKLNYIYWNKEATIENLKREEFQDLYKSLDKSMRCYKKTSRKDFKVGCWNYKKDNDYGTIYIHSNKGEYKMYICNLIDDDKNTKENIYSHRENKGRKALKNVRNTFEEKYGIKMHKAFGTVEKEYLKCVPSQLSYYTKYTGEIECISSVDFCSHYPSCICGKLPDANNYLMGNGTIKPNNEYPFAFYLKSGHIAEYGVFDTHDWIDNYYSYDLFKKHYKNKNWDSSLDKMPGLNPDEDITILMKASAYELTEIYEENYLLRKTNENAKLVMNSSIGEMHTLKYKEDHYAHLAAICIGRANQKILDLAKKIGYFNIIQICVDGIMYKGIKEYGVHEKKLGNLEQEYASKSCFYGGYNKYIVSEYKNPNLPIKWKHGSCDYTNNGIRLDTNYIPSSIYDVKIWKKRTKLEELYEEEKTL